MQTGLLYLNDYRAQLYRGEQAVLSESALLLTEDSQLVSGKQAHARARLEPAKISSHHWQQLNQTPLTPARKGFRHHADLAYRQLEHWLKVSPDAQGVAIASSLMFDTDQQALLAGMCKATGTPLQALVPAPLLQAAGFLQRKPQALSGNFFHLELCQHNALLTELSYASGRMELVRQIPVPDQGAGPLLNRWLNCLARECVRQTRYDPLHTADAEQRLFNQLLPAITQLQVGDNELDIDGNRVKLDRDWLREISAPLLQRVAGQIADAPLLLSPLALRLPNVIGMQLEDTDLVRGFLQLEPLLIDAPLKVHKSLSIQTPNSTPATQDASHLLAGDQAFALSARVNLVKRGSFWQQLASDAITADLTLTCDDHGVGLADAHWQYRPLNQQQHRPQAGDTLTHPRLGELRFIRLEAMPDGA